MEKVVDIRIVHHSGAAPKISTWSHLDDLSVETGNGVYSEDGSEGNLFTFVTILPAQDIGKPWANPGGFIPFWKHTLPSGELT